MPCLISTFLPHGQVRSGHSKHHIRTFCEVHIFNLIISWDLGLCICLSLSKLKETQGQRVVPNKLPTGKENPEEEERLKKQNERGKSSTHSKE